MALGLGFRGAPGADTGSGDEVAVFAGSQRETLRFPLADVEYELSVLPGFILAKIDIKRATANLAQKDIVVANGEFSFFKTHRQAAVTASP